MPALRTFLVRPGTTFLVLPGRRAGLRGTVLVLRGTFLVPMPRAFLARPG